MDPEDILPPPSPEPTPPQPAPPAPTERVPDTLPARQPGERTFTVVKRHPIGMFGIYLMCGLVLIVTAGLAFGVAPSMAADNSSQIMLAGALVFAVVLGICVTVALIAAKIYWGNTWTVTTDSLTQVRQLGLFRRESSQLSLSDIEDVTAEQNGVGAKMFNYGVLRIAVPGDADKFMFPFCPNPNYYAQQILTVKEAFEHNRQAEEQSYRPQVAPAAAQQYAQSAPVPLPAAPAPAPPPVEPPIVPPEQPPAGPGTY